LFHKSFIGYRKQKHHSAYVVNLGLGIKRAQLFTYHNLKQV
jgi:hypothetical protein